MHVEGLCLIALVAGVVGAVFSLFECSQGGPRIAGAGGLVASAVVIGSSLIASAIVQRRKD
jgi:hypothetical protein